MKHKQDKDRSLFERLGGVVVIEKIVREFYQRVTSDRLLSKKFVDVDLEWLMQKQIEVFIEATGGPIITPVQRMRISHIHLPVSEGYFAKMRGHLIDTLHKLTISFPLINEIENLVRPITHSPIRSEKSTNRGEIE
jgi:truncated hemoglobin YjbI